MYNVKELIVIIIKRVTALAPMSQVETMFFCNTTHIPTDGLFHVQCHGLMKKENTDGCCLSTRTMTTFIE